MYLRFVIGAAAIAAASVVNADVAASPHGSIGAAKQKHVQLASIEPPEPQAGHRRSSRKTKHTEKVHKVHFICYKSRKTSAK